MADKIWNKTSEIIMISVITKFILLIIWSSFSALHVECADDDDDDDDVDDDNDDDYDDINDN